MDKFKWIIFAVIAIGILATLVYLSLGSRLDVSTVDTNKIQTASEQNGNIADHVFGNADSSVILMEYGDFQCPGCGAAHPQLKAISEEYSDKIAFVFRNLPLTSIHPNAKAAAAAVEAAGLQGKYWEMHNLIFETQSEWSTLGSQDRVDKFKEYAESINLDIAKFVSDIDSPAIKQKIAFDLALFGKTGLEQSTPTFILNGEKVSAEVSNDAAQANGDMLRELIDSALEKQ